MSNVDKSASFGIQNFFFVQSDDTDVTYNYYGFQNKKGSTLLMRTNKTTTAILYHVTTGVFATVWAARATKTYVAPHLLVEPTII